jgi:hypothetical protein
MPLPVAGYGHRVDRVDRAAGRAKGGDQQPARCLNGHRNRVLGTVPDLGQQRDEFGEALDGLDDAPPGEELTFVVEQRDIVMPLGPVDPARDLIQAVPALPALLSLVRDPDENARRPNSEALWPDLRLSRSRSQQPVRLRSSHQSSRLTSRKVSVVRASSNHERSLDRLRAEIEEGVASES